MFEKLKYFTLYELLKSNTALERNIENIPQDFNVITNLYRVACVLDALRTEIKMPIRVNSGYRSKQLNSAISGHSSTSLHMSGCAADITSRDLPRLVRAVCKYCNLSADMMTDNVYKNDLYEVIVHKTYIHFGIRK